MRVLILSSLTGSCLLYQNFGPDAVAGEDGPTGTRLSSTLFCMNRLVSEKAVRGGRRVVQTAAFRECTCCDAA